MRNRWLISPLLIGLAAGCQTNDMHKTPKQQATDQWNAARAGVQAGLAQQQFTSGEFVKCRATIDEALRLAPDRLDLHILSAKLAIEQGQLELAEKELATARTLAPKDAEAFYLSGVVYQRWQRLQQAEAFYKAASERSPAELSYLLARAEMLVAMDRQAEALPLLQDKVIYFEHSAAIRDAVGQLMMQKGQYADAVDMFRQASVLASDDQSYRERLGLALFHNHQYIEAAEVLNRLVVQESYADRVDLLSALGECQLEMNKPRDAKANFETAARLYPASTRIWLGLGRAALEAGDLPRAELALQKALALNADAAETQLLLGYVRLRQNRMNEAAAAFTRAGALDPKDPLPVCMLGYTLEKQGRGKDATRFYGKALQIDPNDPMAQKLMAGVDPRE